MFFAPNPGVLAAGSAVAPSKTYAEFVAHVTSLATNGAVGWGAEITIGNAAGTTLKHTTTAEAFVGSMGGSPAGSRFAAANSVGSWNRVSRIVQHSLPNGDVSGATSGQVIYLEVYRPDSTTVALSSQTINGFTSSNVAAGLVRSARVTRIIWWDGAKAMWRNPSTGGAETEYVW